VSVFRSCIAWINFVRKSCREHYWILSLMICFLCMVGQSHDSFTLLSVKDVMFLFSIVSRPFKCCAQCTDRMLSEANLGINYHGFVSMSKWEWLKAKKCWN
jgi:hypothetical protein